jgi:outer membrane receptor protein involved in Fe transport
MRQVLSTDPRINTVGFDGGPLHWKGNFGINWELGPWSAGWDAQYYNHYNVCGATDTATVCVPKETRQDSAKIPSQFYHDIYVNYEFDEKWGAVLANAEIHFGIQNLFDKMPPILATANVGNGYDIYADPRLRRFILTIRKHFG